MAEGAYLAEYLERDIETLISANIAAALDVVEAEWSAIDPVTLPNPVNYDRGYRSWMLDLASTAYPYILTIFTERTPNAGQAGRLKMQDVEYAGTVSTFVVADTEAEVVKIAHRYAQAILAILQTDMTFRGCKQRDWKPAVKVIADNVTHLKAGASGDTYDSDDVDYIRLVEIDIVMRETS
jgi:hypothetical protein